MESTPFDSPPRIQVFLANKAVWKQFYPVTEMVALNKGRLIFPHLSYKITGLDPAAMYRIFIYLERVDDAKYKYIDGEWRALVGKGDFPFPIKMIEHYDGVRKGGYWMDGNVSFENLKITNHQNNEGRQIIAVQTGHKFRPVVVVRQVGHYRGEEFRIPLTEFIVVTAYRSHEMHALKTAHNKYAAGHRAKNDNPIVDRSSSSTIPAALTPSPDHSLHSNYAPTLAHHHQITTSNIAHLNYPQALETPPSVQNQNQFSNFPDFSNYYPTPPPSHSPQNDFYSDFGQWPSSYQFNSNYCHTPATVPFQPADPQGTQSVHFPSITPPPQGSLSGDYSHASCSPNTLPVSQKFNKPTDFSGITPVGSVFGAHDQSAWTGPTNSSEASYYSQISNVSNPYYGLNNSQS